MISSKFKHSLIISSMLLLQACSGQNGISFNKIGNSVLNLVGLGAAKSAYDMQDSLKKATNELTREEEYYLGRAVAARIISDYPIYNQEKINIYINKVGLALVNFSDKPETFGGYHFIVLDTEEVNALAAPGGFIFLTKGLLNLLPDEDGLAAVLAHEIVHVEKQHGLKSISAENMTKAIQSIGKLASSLNCAEVLTSASAVFGAAVDDMIGKIINSGYSREQEAEADKEALSILAKSGYSVNAFVDTLSLLKQRESQAKKGSWTRSHPGLEERLDQIVSELKKNPVQDEKKGREIRFARFEQEIRF